MAPSPSRPPPHAAGSSPPPPTTSSTFVHSSPPLNPNATPFLPSSIALGEELPEWLLFSPSSSEGRSLALGHIFGASSVTSFADVVRGKGMAPMDPVGPPPEVGPSRRSASQAALTSAHRPHRALLQLSSDRPCGARLYSSIVLPQMSQRGAPSSGLQAAPVAGCGRVTAPLQMPDCGHPQPQVW
jgi:hypothetical protein